MNRSQIGRRIRSLRTAANLTQEEFGATLNITGQAVAHWERGRSLPPITELPAIAHALGVSVAEFYGEPSRPPGPEIEIAVPSGERYIVQVKSEANKDRALDFLRQVVNGTLRERAERIVLLIDTPQTAEQPQPIELPAGASFAKLLMDEWRAMSTRERRELVSAFTGEPAEEATSDTGH